MTRGARWVAAGLVLALVLVGCTTRPEARRGAEQPVGVVVPPPEVAPPATRAQPPVPDGPLAPEVAEAVATVFGDFTSFADLDAITALGDGGDARVLWLLADYLQFYGDRTEGAFAEQAASRLAGLDVASLSDPAWVGLTDQLIAWDLPAPPGYREHKAALFGAADEAWAPLFADEDATIDWRLVAFGGVRADTRPSGDDRPCELSCIPALDDPAVVPVVDATWLAADETVIGLVVDGEARAYPRRVLAVHELVNDTVGGVRIAVPYCTLCGTATAYVTEDVRGSDGPLVLRTSGLLVRSNKVLFDLGSTSIVDTFTGEARSGPLLDRGVVLDRVPVVVATWGAWAAAHPDGTVVAEDGGIGRGYPPDPFDELVAAGPTFPTGPVDPRLAAGEVVFGVPKPGGAAIAFHAREARAALRDGGLVRAGGVTLALDGDGLRALGPDGAAVAGHESFWFAWSQFHPTSPLWRGGPATEPVG